MEHLDNIVGLDESFSELTLLLEDKNELKIFVQGPDGRGKTTLLNYLSQHLSSKGYCCIQLSGDQSRSTESFYPFKQFVERKQRTFSKRVSAFKESVGSIPYLGKTIKALIEDYDFKNKKSQKTLEDIYPFKEHLDFSAHLVALYRKYERLVLICDDIDYFDEATLRYIEDIEQGFSILNGRQQLQLIMCAKSVPTGQLNLGGYRIVQLPALTHEQVKRFIYGWSGVMLSDEEFQLIESCSGFHLNLLKIIALHIKENGVLSKDSSTNDFFWRIIDSRLRQLKDKYEQIKNLLVTIFQSGKRTTVLELICLLGEDNEVRSLVNQAIQLEVLTITENYIHFSHPVYEKYVQAIQKPKPAFLHQLSVCLKKLSPSDYKRRAMTKEAAGNVQEADTLWALAAIARMREGSFSDTGRLLLNLKSFELATSLREALSQFRFCYELSFSGEIDKTLLEIEKVSNALPKEIVAEKVYLKSELLLKKIANLPKKEALQLIEQWEDIKEDEPEIWYRLLQSKIIIAAELGQRDIALKAESEIIKYFSARLVFDPYSRLILQRLNLFSEVLYTPEVAHRKMIESERYFTEEVRGEQFNRIIDLYVVRCNLSSNSLLIDEKEKAIEFAQGSLSLLEAYKEFKFPYPEIPLSNLCLALWFQDEGNLPFVLNVYKQIWSSSFVEENKMLVDVNYAGFLLFSDRYEESLATLQNATYIPEDVSDDAYYYYYYWSNFSLVSFLNGDRTKAIEKVEQLRLAAPLVSFALAKYYVKHLELLQEVFLQGAIVSHQQVQAYISKRADIFSSRLWDRFKQGYILTDMQIWTAS